MLLQHGYKDHLVRNDTRVIQQLFRVVCELVDNVNAIGLDTVVLDAGQRDGGCGWVDMGVTYQKACAALEAAGVKLGDIAEESWPADPGTDEDG